MALGAGSTLGRDMAVPAPGEGRVGVLEAGEAGWPWEEEV